MSNFEPLVKRFKTNLGCTVTVSEAPEHLGDGVLLLMEVDTKWAEVFLDKRDMNLLSETLDVFRV